MLRFLSISGFVIFGLMAAYVGLCRPVPPAAAALANEPQPQSAPATDLSAEERSELQKFLREARRLVPPLPPVEQVPTANADDAEDRVEPDELVLGVALHGDARAYPLNMINRPERKVLNDRIGGQSVLIAWCDLCHTAAAFSRTTAGEDDVFGCSGMLWREMLVMYDVRTRSLWNHLMGKAVAGPRRGESLPRINSTITTWQSWKETYPETTVAVGDRAITDLTLDYFHKPTLPSGFVYGIRTAFTGKAWTLGALQKQRVISTEVDNQPAVIFFDPQSCTAQMYANEVDGNPLSFHATERGVIDTESGSRWNMVSGQAVEGPRAGEYLTPLPGVWAFERSWKLVFPGAPVASDEPADFSELAE